MCEKKYSKLKTQTMYIVYVPKNKLLLILPNVFFVDTLIQQIPL